MYTYHDQRTCTATLVSNNKILTSASCLLPNRTLPTLAFATTNTDEPYYKVDISSEDEIFIHPEYDDDTKDNDICVIELKTALKFGQKIGKIDMVDKGYVAKMGDTISMFAFAESDNPQRSYYDTQLQYIESKIVNLNICNYYSDDEKLVPKKDKQFCVTLPSGTTINTGGKDQSHI